MGTTRGREKNISSPSGGMESKANLLIIGDDFSRIEQLKSIPLIKTDFSLYSCNTEGDLLASIKNNSITIAIIDINGTKKEELALLRRLKRFDPLLDVIIIGGHATPEEVMDWIRKGATDYLAEPLETKLIRQTLEKIAGRRSLRRETLLLEKKLEKKYVFQDMVSRNPSMLEVFHLVEKISKYFTSVLVTGETGTGKEMIARAIHALSPCNNRKLVICDCASIPENLFESELFGYVKGAFTGAEKDKKGLFEEAHEGTIFLDEIAEIPVSIQAKLLRVLENRQFRSLGSTVTKNVDVRVIAATSRDLREGIKNRSFREDLFHRLNKVEVHIFPLRERKEDIPLLTRYFLDKYRTQFSKELKGISRQVQKLFLKYDWPGNVRELENVIERASLICKKDFIDVQDLPKNLQELLGAGSGPLFIDKLRLSTLEDLEKKYINYVIKATGRNMKKAARILSISRTTLYNKLAKYKIPD